MGGGRSDAHYVLYPRERYFYRLILYSTSAHNKYWLKYDKMNFIDTTRANSIVGQILCYLTTLWIT